MHHDLNAFFSSRHFSQKRMYSQRTEGFFTTHMHTLHFNHTNTQMGTHEHKMQDQLTLRSSSFFNLTAFIPDSFFLSFVVFFTDNISVIAVACLNLEVYQSFVAASWSSCICKSFISLWRDGYEIIFMFFMNWSHKCAWFINKGKK